MRIVFMGTPEFAVPHLDRLLSDGHEIACVFTRRDSPAKRGMKLLAPPVKEFAVLQGLPVYQPGGFKNGRAFEKLKALAPDMIVVVAYGRLLPKEVLELPRYGCINIHASLLPKYRGAAPINRAVVNGETESGVTAMFMAEELDAGDMIMTGTCPVYPNDTAGTLHDRLMELGPGVLSDAVCAVGDGSFTRTPQEHAKATFAPPINKSDAKIDWSKSAVEIKNLVRGMNPWPGAFADFGGVQIKIHETEALEGESSDPPGTVIDSTGGIIVAAGKGQVRILRLQPPGKRPMSAEDYLRGHKL